MIRYLALPLVFMCVACADEVVKPAPLPEPVVKKLVPTGKSTCLDGYKYFEVERPNDWPVWLRLLKDGKPYPC